MKTFEDVVFEPYHIKRFSEIAMSKSEIKNKFGDLIKQLQELVLHLFDKNESTEIYCKITSVHNKENDEWVDGITLPDGEFSKINLKDLSEYLKQKKKILPCPIKFTDNNKKRSKEPVINGYIKFLHPKTDKQNDPSMPWENKSESKSNELVYRGITIERKRGTYTHQHNRWSIKKTSLKPCLYYRILGNDSNFNGWTDLNDIKYKIDKAMDGKGKEQQMYLWTLQTLKESKYPTTLHK